MKAAVHHEYGPPEVIQIVEMEKPTPQGDEVLVRIHAASLNAYDWHMLTADIFLVRLMGGGLLRPKNPRLGADIAGVVEAVGPEVTQFQVGDEVYGEVAGRGGFGEYTAAPQRALARKPSNLSFEESAAVPMAGLTALQGLRDEGQIQAGQKVLINGASGGVGTFALQIAKAFGGEVTAVCSTRNLEQARQLGADHVIDYTQENFTKQDTRYDLIFAANGYHPLADYKRALKPEGRYVMAGGETGQIFEVMLLGPLLSINTDKQLGNVSARVVQQDLQTLTEMVEAGLIAPVIDRRYPLSETAEALRYLGEGHARGKVIIQMMPDADAK